MKNVLKKSALAILVTGFAISAASIASAQSAGGNGNGGNGNGGSGGQAGADGGMGSGDNPETPKPGGNRINRLGYIVIDHVPARNPTFPPPRRPRVYVEQVGNTSCDPLYNRITRSNMLKTVPAYQECLRKTGY